MIHGCAIQMTDDQSPVAFAEAALVLVAWGHRFEGAVNGVEVVGNGGTHQFMIKISDNFARVFAKICDKVVESRKNVIFQQLDGIDILVLGCSVDHEEAVTDVANTGFVSVPEIDTKNIAKSRGKSHGRC